MKTKNLHQTEALSALTAVQELAAAFAPISLAEMSGVALLRRTDTKYVMSTWQLCDLLAGLSPHYRILDINGVRLHDYQTLYFDTPDFALYRRHHSGGLNRYKVRYRKYVDTDLCFLEVKLKNNKRQTVKSRMRTSCIAAHFDSSTGDFLHDHVPFDPATIEPKIWNGFRRLTLVSNRRVERLTIDLDLGFGSGFGSEFSSQHRDLVWPGLVIAEVKQPKFSVDSEFIQMTRTLGVRPRDFSKYCMGVSEFYGDEVPHNRFKPNQLLIDNLTAEGQNSYVRSH